MNVSELVPPPKLKTLFRLSAIRQVPKGPGCYVLTTSVGLILYVGLAVSLSARFRQHLENPEKTNLTKYGRAFLFHCLDYDMRNLNRLERSWLNQYVVKHGSRPVLNKADSPVN